MSYTGTLKQMWAELYDPELDTIETIEKYFHPDFEQSINDVVLNKKQYIEHVIEQKKNMTITKIEYQYVLEEGNKVFTVYRPEGKNKNNLPVEAEVIAYFEFKDEKIYRTKGLVKLIKGDLADADMNNES